MYSARAPRTSRHFYPRPPRGGRRGPKKPRSARTLFLSTPSARRATVASSSSTSVSKSFLSTPSARRATRPNGGPAHAKIFLSTPSARRATCTRPEHRAHQDISIHALREEGDINPEPDDAATDNFYPRPPRGGRPAGMTEKQRAEFNFYPRPPRGGRRASGLLAVRATAFLSTPSARRATVAIEPRDSGRAISIHALREEGDRRRPPRQLPVTHFYPRPPRGGRQEPVEVPDISKIFLSTPSARRATTRSRGCAQRQQISIHALREEGDRGRLRKRGSGLISIHALREEGDTTAFPLPPSTANFYPRPPRGGRPATAKEPDAGGKISIHALREEGDRDRRDKKPSSELFLSTPSARRATLPFAAARPFHQDFYPRPPRGGRPELRQEYLDILEFLSTPSARRATDHPGLFSRGVDISIHALREEGDACAGSAGGRP